MDRYDFYFRQPVAESEMDDAFDAVEQALWDLAVDTDLIGVMANAVVTEHSGSPNETVDVSGSSVVYDKAGQRIAWGPVQNVDVSTDYQDVSTAVSAPGNEKIVSLFAKFDRTLSDPRIDGNSLTVYWNRAETFDFHVKQGAEASPPATPPALESEYILLADIRRAYGDTTIANADITGPTGTYVGHTDRREDVFVISHAGSTLRAGTPEEIAQELMTHLSSSSSLAFTASENWKDGSSLAATDVEAAINEIVADLASQTDGNKRIGAPAYSGGNIPVTNGSIYSQIVELCDEAAGLTKVQEFTLANTFSGGIILDSSVLAVGLSGASQVSWGNVQNPAQTILDSPHYIDIDVASGILAWRDSSNNEILRLTEDTGDVYLNVSTGRLEVQGGRAGYCAIFNGTGRVRVQSGDLEVYDNDIRMTGANPNIYGDVNATGILVVGWEGISGTGTTDGRQLKILGCTGQNTSGSDNNDGGEILMQYGRPSENGGGADGESGQFTEDMFWRDSGGRNGKHWRLVREVEAINIGDLQQWVYQYTMPLYSVAYIETRYMVVSSGTGGGGSSGGSHVGGWFNRLGAGAVALGSPSAVGPSSNPAQTFTPQYGVTGNDLRIGVSGGLEFEDQDVLMIIDVWEYNFPTTPTPP